MTPWHLILHFLVHKCVDHIDISDTAEKQVICDQCRKKFSYRMSRRVILDIPLMFPGIGAYGHRVAEKRLVRQLRTGVDPVACPSCGWMQANMIPELRRRFLQPLRKAGVIIINSFLGIVLLIGIGAAWISVRKISVRGLDINWLGIVLCCCAGAIIGIALIGLRHVMAMLRYESGGFNSHREWTEVVHTSLPRSGGKRLTLR